MVASTLLGFIITDSNASIRAAEGHSVFVQISNATKRHTLREWDPSARIHGVVYLIISLHAKIILRGRSRDAFFQNNDTWTMLWGGKCLYSGPLLIPISSSVSLHLRVLLHSTSISSRTTSSQGCYWGSTSYSSFVDSCESLEGCSVSFINDLRR